jgi:hypothetical protein
MHVLLHPVASFRCYVRTAEPQRLNHRIGIASQEDGCCMCSRGWSLDRLLHSTWIHVGESRSIHQPIRVRLQLGPTTAYPAGRQLDAWTLYMRRLPYLFLRNTVLKDPHTYVHTLTAMNAHTHILPL